MPTFVHSRMVITLCSKVYLNTKPKSGASISLDFSHFANIWLLTFIKIKWGTWYLSGITQRLSNLGWLWNLPSVCPLVRWLCLPMVSVPKQSPHLLTAVSLSILQDIGLQGTERITFIKAVDLLYATLFCAYQPGQTLLLLNLNKPTKWLRSFLGEGNYQRNKQFCYGYLS